MRRSVLRSSAAPSSRTAARSSFVSLVSISSALGALALLPFSGLAGCSSSGSTSDDGGTGASDGSTQVGDGSSTSDAGVSDGSATADGDTEGAVVLVNNGDYTTSSGEVVALDPISGTTLGRLAYGSGDGALASTSRAPFLLERDKDVVHELDPRTPWISRGTWNVRGDDRPDGGLASANPRGVVFTTGTRDYVVRFNRNRIARIEGSGADAAAPTAFVDLASYASAADADGVVEPTDGFFDPTSNRLFVLLGRIDLTKVASDGFSILSTASKPVLVAIDTTTDALVNLGGSASAEPSNLGGQSDGARLRRGDEKVHVLHAGCNQPGGDGGAGAPISVASRPSTSRRRPARFPSTPATRASPAASRSSTRRRPSHRSAERPTCGTDRAARSIARP
ncbi:MAG: hypothetical protein U0169_20100 [Polyangiaceae bacterium]